MRESEISEAAGAARSANGHSHSQDQQHELTSSQKIEIYQWMILTRIFDERMLAYWRQGKGVGGAYSQRGHEAVSIGSGYALGADDVVAPMHRDLGCYLLRGLTPRRIFANLLGKATGVTRGKDANLHGMGDLDLGLIGFISHLPLSMPVALGAAVAFKIRGENRVALTYSGDGASSAGPWHETLNMAAVYQAPFVLVVENNQYAYSTPVSEQTRVKDLADRAAGYGIPGVVVDGNDVEAVYRATRRAVERARHGDGPSLIEAKTMRMLGHAIHDGAEYVPDDLLEEWKAKDPVARFQRRLLESAVLTDEQVESTRKSAEQQVEDAIAFAEQSPLPDPDEVLTGVYASALGQ